MLLTVILISSFILSPVTTVHAISIPAEVNKQFTPIFIDAGGISVLRVSIFNPNSFPLTNASWTDNLIGVQPGLLIANPAGVNHTCGAGAIITAAPNTTTLSLSGGTVPAQTGATPGECYVEINVTSTTPGNLINTIPIGNLNSNGNDGGNPVIVSNTTPASATLTVVSVTPPSISKGFSPNTISMGDVSTLTITINNNDTNTNLTGTSFTDTLPANVVLANPVSPTLTNCGVSASLAATAGNNTITLTNATVTPSQNCVVTVNVTSATQGAYVNTIPAGPGNPGSIVTQQGVTNASPASATLNVQPINITKQFDSASFQAGGINTLTITLQNPTASPYTGVNLSDTLPTTPNTNLTYVVPSSATTCAPPGTVSNTATTVTLIGGTIPANSSCTITVNVTTPNGALPATYTNVIPPGAIFITSNPNVTNVTQATADVSVYATGTGMTGSVKTFVPDPIDAGQNTRLRIDLFAPADTNLTNFSMTDNLPAGVTVSNVDTLGVPTPPTTSGCGAAPPRVLTANTGDTVISLTGGTILAGARCRINVWVTSSTPGTVTNTISPADISNNENRDPSGDLTDTLTVNPLDNLSVSKAFYPPTVSPNGLSILTITLQNTYPSPLINVSLTDNLPGSLTDGVVVAPGLDGNGNASTTCTPGLIIATPLSQTITMTGGTVPAQVGAVPGICTITVTVQGKDSNATPSNRINTIPTPNVSGTVQSTGVTINPINQAQATLRTEILTIGVVKGFNPVLVYGGAASTMSVQLVNPNNADLTGIAFTDDMSLLLPGMFIANPANLNVGTCGGAITGNPGDTSFSFSGGFLPANTNCTLTLSVSMNVNGNRTNRIPAGAVTTFNGVSSPDPAEASLTNLPGASISKAFGTNPILAGNTSVLTITIQNTSIVPLTAMGLIDTLPAGLLITGMPTAPDPVNNCGGALTAAPGTQLIQLSGGSLNGNLSCTIVVSVTSSIPGSYTNTIPIGTLTNTEGATNNVAATDTLVVTASTSSIQIVKTPSAILITPGDPVTYSYVVTNTGQTPLTNIIVTDDKCSPVTYVSGDTNTNNTLETNETWNYSCTTTLTATTTNIATASGSSGNVLVQDTDTVTVNVSSTGMSKIITGTSESFTTGNNVAVGEIVTYQITMNIPIGPALDNVVVTDRMDKGLAFVDCVSVNLAGTDITNTVCPPTVSPITDPGDAATNPANPGRQVQFNIGTIPAPNAASTLVIRYRAVVLDVIENQETDRLNNNATMTWTGGSLTASATDVTVVEPDLAIDKSASTTTVTAGTSIQFTLVVSNTALSSTDSFDVVVTDVLPNGLEYIACTPITYSGLVPTTQPDPCNIPGGKTLTFGWDSFPFNQSATIVFFARFDGTQPSVINNASVSWTSLPIDLGPDGNPVESSIYNDTSTERWYDPNDPVDAYQVLDGVGINLSESEEEGEGVVLPSGLPATGFAPNVITTLPEQPAEKAYTATDVWLEIPSLGVNIPIVGVPLVEQDWDVSWLWRQAGWLNGTAFPGWQGNSALTGHVTLPNGKSGPFVGLGQLKWGDQILVHAYGSVYIYEVRQNRTISPNNTSVLKHEEEAWLTLITCKTYNESTNSYARRIAVRATLVNVELEKQTNTSKGGR